MTSTVTARFADGFERTRRTEATYTHASRKDGKVRFHTSEEAARRAAGAYGEVVSTDCVAAAEPINVRAAEAKLAAYAARREFGRDDPRARAAVDEWRRIAGLEPIKWG